MLYLFERGPGEAKVFEIRLRADGPGYELVIREGEAEHVESFDALPPLLAREHELMQAWRATGWRLAGPGGRR